ncbi:MAG: hypothetical protein K0S56_1810 [Microvirga sp.]|jgi:alkylation response protein AidB-like acyl-CoA dehydrogenase|nr:hypothetical protein [Microvirga sp.]
MLDIEARGWRRAGSLLDDLRRVAARASARACDVDQDGTFPRDDIADLAAAGALAAPFTHFNKGAPDELAQSFRIIGHASLPLGRLYEGHVNAAALIGRFGTTQQQALAGRQAAGGALFGVWNTEGENGVQLVRANGRLELAGSKTFASGAGHVGRPLITARDEKGDLLMVLPRLDGALRADLSAWRAHGMRASATGSFRFDGIPVDTQDIIGAAGDYHRQPHFSAGAWRFCAVQLGGIERLVEETARFLREHGRGNDPYQLARMGEATIAAETARLWVERAASVAEAPEIDATPEASRRTVAYVNLARGAVERSGLEVMQLVQRSIGLPAFLRTSPVERLCRDLATYLRQPAPDRALCEAASHVLSSEAKLSELWR